MKYQIILTTLLFSTTYAFSDVYTNLESLTHWQRVSSKPILQSGAKGSYDERLEEPEILFENNVYHVWYAAWENYSVGTIGYASGPSLDKLTKQGIALGPGPSGSFDQGYVSGPRIYEQDGTYYLFYFGFSSAGFEKGGASIGVATASDPSGPWTRQATALIRPGAKGSWDDQIIYRPFLIKESDTYFLYFNARGSSGHENIGFATSKNILGPYTEFSNNPVIQHGSNSDRWNWRRVGDIDILDHILKGSYVSFFFGQPDQKGGLIGLATAPSVAGPWTQRDEPLLLTDESGRTLRPAIRPAIYYDGNDQKWRMLFDDVGRGIYVADIK